MTEIEEPPEGRKIGGWVIFLLIALVLLAVLARHHLGWDTLACKGSWDAQNCR